MHLGIYKKLKDKGQIRVFKNVFVPVFRGKFLDKLFPTPRYSQKWLKTQNKDANLLKNVIFRKNFWSSRKILIFSFSISFAVFELYDSYQLVFSINMMPLPFMPSKKLDMPLKWLGT